MKNLRNSGHFLFVLLINMILSFEWTIPAWILLVCHFVADWSIWWFWLALGLWICGILLWMGTMSWAVRCGSTPDQPKENKNPYSRH